MVNRSFLLLTTELVVLEHFHRNLSESLPALVREIAVELLAVGGFIQTILGAQFLVREQGIQSLQEGIATTVGSHEIVLGVGASGGLDQNFSEFLLGVIHRTDPDETLRLADTGDDSTIIGILEWISIGIDGEGIRKLDDECGVIDYSLHIQSLY